MLHFAPFPVFICERDYGGILLYEGGDQYADPLKQKRPISYRSFLLFFLILIQAVLRGGQSGRKKLRHLHAAGDQVLADRNALVDRYVECQNAPHRRRYGN